MPRNAYWCIGTEGTCMVCDAEFETLSAAKDHYKKTGHPTSHRKIMETLVGDWGANPKEGKNDA